jgi:multisubunit Na+/H+ antiporter MnhF subunit
LIAFAAIVGMLAATALAAVRLIGGPTLQDRILAANLLIVLCATMSAAFAALWGAAGAIDVALALLLGAYAINIAALKMFKLGTFQAALARAREPG